MGGLPSGAGPFFKRVNGSISISVIAFILAGLAVSYIFVNYPWKTSIIILGALIVATLTLSRTEYSLYLFFVLLLMTTDAVTERMVENQNFFAIPEIDLPGIPSVLNFLFLFIFSIYFAKYYLLEKKRSAVPLYYLIAYVIVLIIALAIGATRPEATSDSLRLEFMKMLLPVLCFYVCINLFDNYNKIQNMIWVLFSVCVIKAGILDVYYLAGKGFPFVEMRIVSYDTAELTAFVVMCLISIMMITYGKIKGMWAWLMTFFSFPLLFAVLFSFRRANWLGMLGSIGLLYLWSPQRQRRKIAPFLFGPVLLFIPIFCFFLITNMSFPMDANSNFSRVSSRFMTMFDPNQASNRHHLYEGIQVLKDIMKSPFFGLGLASAHSPVDKDLGMWVEELQPLDIVHNTFLYMWMKTGLLGFLFFLWLGYKYTKEVMHYAKNYRSSENWPLTASMGSAICIWFVHFMSGPVPFYLHQSYLIAIFAAMVHSLIRLDKQRYPEMSAPAV